MPSIKNDVVTRVHAKETRWPREFAALRTLCLASGLTESLKWGQACYSLEERNVVVIHGFNEYCALLFFKGALLADADGQLVQQTKNVQAARQLRFTSLADIKKRAGVITSHITEAMALEKAGAKVVMKTAAEFEVCDEFRERLDDDVALADAFRALTPGRQKAYLLHFGGAKLAATRRARVEKHVARILQGLGLDD
jgi:uncharacterized protein YdeI (YjbR/CyaY-like superfamily)